MSDSKHQTKVNNHLTQPTGSENRSTCKEENHHNTQTKANNPHGQSSAAYQVLHRPWSTESGSPDQNTAGWSPVDHTPAAIERWLGESTQEQPWNNVGSFAELKPSKKN